MADNLIQSGQVFQGVTLVANDSAGDFKLFGTNILGQVLIKSTDTTGVVEIGGVRSVTKATGVNFSFGSKVYWNNANSNVTSISTNNTEVGFAVSPAANNDTSVEILLNGLPQINT